MKLILGDCLEKMLDIEDHSIDSIITDPPYNISYAEWDVFPDIEKLCLSFDRIIKPNGSIFIFSGWSFVANIMSIFNQHFTLNDWIIYDRIKGRGALKRLVSTREDLLWYVKGKEWVFNKEVAYSTIVKKTKGMGSKNGKDCRALSNVWTDISPLVPWSKERVDHPTQKPLQLMERIVSVFSEKNSLILDPFMGSGSTGVACKKLERHFIGIEKNQDYFELSKSRISNI